MCNFLRILAKYNQVKSFAIKGDIGATYDAVINCMTKFGFKESSSTWPSDVEFTRGSKGLFAKNLKEVKTTINVSLKQSDAFVNVMFDYNLNIPSSFVSKSDNEIEIEYEKIKHELTSVSSVPVIPKVCDVCMSEIAANEKFCKNCGRSSTREKVTQSNVVSETDVFFDKNRIAFGQKVVDDLLYGGIPPNYVTLLTSIPCEEKNAIITKYLETGLDTDEIVVYVSGNGQMAQNKKTATNPNYHQIICHPNAELEVSKTLPKENEIAVKGVERLTDLSVALTSMFNNIAKKSENNSKPKRLVLDILSDVLLSNETPNVRKWLRDCITKFKHNGFTVIATLNPHMHSKEETYALLDLFDGHVDLYEKEANPDGTFMKIKRLNNAKYSNKETLLVRDDFVIQNHIND